MCDSQSPRPTPVVLTISLREIGVLGQPACSQPLSGLPRRLAQPPGPHSLLTSATSQGHPSLCHRGPVPHLPAPHRGSAQPASPASPFSVPVPGEQSSRFLRPLFPIACSRMPGLRGRGQLFFSLAGASTSPAGKRPCPHLSDILLIFFSPFSDIRPLRARSRSLAIPRSQHLVRSGHRASPRPSEGGHRRDFKASLPHVSLRFPRGPFIHFISVFHFEGFSC